MGNFEQTCKQIDTRFDTIMGTDSTDEPAPVMLIRAAAKLIVSRYPDHGLRSMALANLQSCAGHLKSLEAMSDVRHD